MNNAPQNPNISAKNNPSAAAWQIQKPAEHKLRTALDIVKNETSEQRDERLYGAHPRKINGYELSADFSKKSQAERDEEVADLEHSAPKIDRADTPDDKISPETFAQYRKISAAESYDAALDFLKNSATSSENSAENPDEKDDENAGDDDDEPLNAQPKLSGALSSAKLANLRALQVKYHEQNKNSGAKTDDPHAVVTDYLAAMGAEKEFAELPDDAKSAVFSMLDKISFDSANETAIDGARWATDPTDSRVLQQRKNAEKAKMELAKKLGWNENGGKLEPELDQAEFKNLVDDQMELATLKKSYRRTLGTLPERRAGLESQIAAIHNQAYAKLKAKILAENPDLLPEIAEKYCDKKADELIENYAKIIEESEGEHAKSAKNFDKIDANLDVTLNYAKFLKRRGVSDRSIERRFLDFSDEDLAEIRKIRTDPHWKEKNIVERARENVREWKQNRVARFALDFARRGFVERQEALRDLRRQAERRAIAKKAIEEAQKSAKQRA